MRMEQYRLLMEQAERLHEAGLVKGVEEILEKCFERDGWTKEGREKFDAWLSWGCQHHPEEITNAY